MDKEAYLREIMDTVRQGPYHDTWESLSSCPVPQWYRQAKLGFFIHWGVYSVPAFFTEWYPRLMYYKTNPVYWHHCRKYGKDFDYHQFIPMFKAEQFDPEHWLELLQACGADFVMPVAEHHDGFKMYRSEMNEWNAVNMGPRRDVLGEIRAACEKRDIKFSAASHRAEHHWFMNGGATLGRKNATQEEAYREFYGPCANLHKHNGLLTLNRFGGGETPKEWLEDWLMSSCEVVDRYQPANFYFDFWTMEEAFRPYMRIFLAYYYNRARQWGREVFCFYKGDAMLYPCGVYARERGQLEGISPDPWQCETSTAYNSWSYCTTNRFKTAEVILRNMIDVWSKNGCMTLNIGPKADGSICGEETALLQTISAWMQKHKEAVWGTGPYRVFGEGKKQKAANLNERYQYGKKDFRFTYRLGTLYAFALVPKGRKRFRIHQISKRGSCNAIVKAVTLLEDGRQVEFREGTKFLELRLDRPVTHALPICFKITLE